MQEPQIFAQYIVFYIEEKVEGQKNQKEFRNFKLSFPWILVETHISSYRHMILEILLLGNFKSQHLVSRASKL